MPEIPTFWKLRLKDCHEFQASLVYIKSSRVARAT